MSTPPGPTSPSQTNELQHDHSVDAAAVAASSELDNVRCMGCAYSLKGLTVAAKCPECGIAARVSLDFSRDLGGLTSPDVLLGLRIHAFVVAVSAALFLLVLIAPVLMLAAFVLWIGFTVGTCYLADLNALPRNGRRSLMFFAIVGSTALTVLSPFIAMSLQFSPSMGFFFLLMALGNALQFYLIMERHHAISTVFAKFGQSRTPILFTYFTALLHGIVGLPLVVFLSVGMMITERAALGPGIAILYSLPLHGVWLIWLGIRSAYYARKLRRWSMAAQPRLPA